MATVCLSALYKNFEIAAVIPPAKSNPTSAPFVNYAKALELEVFEYEDTPDTPDIIEKLKAKEATIGVICSFDKLLNKDFLNTTKLGYINCHPSLLPNYRGANPYFHIINNGEKTSGVTLHLADENFDTGEIIMQRGMALEEKETIGTLFNRCNFMIADMLSTVLGDLRAGKEIVTKPQLSGDFIKAPKMSTDININLNMQPVEIERLIRASNPFYNTFLMFRGTMLRIFSADYKNELHGIECGVITKIGENYMEVAVSGGYIYPKTVQSGSWGIFDISDFISIFKPNVGEKLK